MHLKKVTVPSNEASLSKFFHKDMCIIFGRPRRNACNHIMNKLELIFKCTELKNIRRLPSSGMLRHVTLVRTDVSEENIASIIRAKRIGELGTTLAVTSNRNQHTSVACYC
jgi:hypothetical protein